MRKLKKRYGNSIYWIAAFTGCVIFSAAMLFGVLFATNSYTSARMELENNYKKAFYEMADGLNGVEVNLSKMMVSSDEEQIVDLAEDVRVQSLTAQGSLNRLPIGAETAFGMNKFLNQVGDWCDGYCHALYGSGECSVFEDKIEEIYTATRNVNAEIKLIADDIKNNKYSIYSSINRRGIKSAGNLEISCDSLNGDSIGYPELIYDGPFSDREGEKCFKALDKLPLITEADALAKVSEMFSGDALRNVRLLAKTSNPNSYDFIGDISGGTMYVSISENGGKLLSINTDLMSSGEKITKEEAQRLAASYAESCEYCCELVPVWYNSVDGVAYVNLAPLCEGIIYYPDLIKAKIALDDGRLIALEAMGFCTNNCVRELTPQISEKTAKGLVSQKLTANNCRLTLIPIGQTEKLCYEVACEYKDLDYYVYIDAQTGKQIKILRIIDEGQGEMAF